jgi:rhamnogalacturonyl hydrolase YesR
MRVALALLLPALSALARPSSYAQWAADSGIARGQGNGLTSGSPKVNYEHGEFWFALQRLYERSGNATYYNYIKSGVDQVVSSAGVVGGGYKYVAHSLLVQFQNAYAHS